MQRNVRVEAVFGKESANGLGLFSPVGRQLWRWETPDPEDDWVMVGHLLLTLEGAVLVGPPLVPGLLDHMDRLGVVHAVILTTHDHTRGAGWLGRRPSCPVYVPLQSLDHPLIEAKIVEATPYRDGDRLPGRLVAERIRVTLPMWDDDQGAYVDEMALFTVDGGVLTGDIAMGGPAGQRYLCPEGLSRPAAPHKVQASLSAFHAMMQRHPDTHTLLASHGHDLAGTLVLELRRRTTAI
jgi:hypothetical protein